MEKNEELWMKVGQHRPSTTCWGSALLKVREGVEALNQSIPECGSVASSRLSGVELRQRALRNPLQHLLGEDSQKLPADVQSLVDRPVVVRA